MTTNTPLTGNFTNFVEDNTEPLVYTCEQARKLLGKCSKDTFYAGIKSGIIPHIKLSDRKIIIPKKMFHAWLDGKLLTPTPENDKAGQLAAGPAKREVYEI